jgi:hypothetical protein
VTAEIRALGVIPCASLDALLPLLERSEAKPRQNPKYAALK